MATSRVPAFEGSGVCAYTLPDGTRLNEHERIVHDFRVAERMARKDQRYPIELRLELADLYRQQGDAWERAARDGVTPIGCEHPARSLGVSDRG